MFCLKGTLLYNGAVISGETLFKLLIKKRKRCNLDINEVLNRIIKYINSVLKKKDDRVLKIKQTNPI